MTRLFVPEIGTKLKLATDWTFALHNESRNSALWDAFACEIDPAVFTAMQLVYQAQQAFEDAVNRRDKRIGHSTSAANVLQQAVEIAYDNMITTRMDKVSHRVTIVADTVLQLDRIYVRKGKEDYSSLSWLIESSPDSRLAPVPGTKGFTKGKKRFWAKLDDCNRIEFV